MRPQWIGRRWRAGVLAAALAGSSGCLNFLHPAPPVPEDAVACCKALPQACRNRVYIFLINGNDPAHYANLDGVRDQLISLGYIKTYCGPYYDYGWYKDEILRIHQEDENARFAVMGFSVGARTARELVHAVAPDGVTVDLLMYCGPVTLPNEPRSRPENALHVVSVSGQGMDWVVVPISGADNIIYPDVSHYGSPTHPYTVELLAKELAEVASRVPVIDARPAADPTLEQGPPPRAAKAREAMRPDEWDFLKPRSPLEPPAMPKAP